MSLDEVRQQVVETVRQRVAPGLESFANLQFPGWRSSRTLRLVTVSIAIGVLGALGAELFLKMIGWAEQALLVGIAGYEPAELLMDGGTLGGPATKVVWVLALVPALGGLLSGLLIHWAAPYSAQIGMDSVIDAFHERGGSMNLRAPLVGAIASALTLGSGGSVGREGPMAEIGAGLGNLLGKPLDLPVPDRRILMLAGVAAGISAIFKSPLGAAFVAVEVLYSGVDFEVESLMYTIISASVGYAVSGLFGSWEPIFVIPAGLQLHSGLELVWYALLGVVAGAVGLMIPHALYSVEAAWDRLRAPAVIRPAAGGLLVGIIALALPQVLGGGYGWIEQALHGQLTLTVLVALVIAKLVATSLSIGSGGAGGLFAPSVYIGAMLGAALAISLHMIAPEATAELDVAAMTVVGMAALFSGVARAPVSTLVLAVEMTGGYGLLVPTMIATVTAYLISQSFETRVRPPHPLLYRAQTPSRMHSPTHQSEYIDNVLHVIDSAQIDLEHERMTWQELELHLRQGDPIPMGPDGQFMYSAQVSPGSVFAGQPVAELPLVSKEVLIASLIRAGHHMTPHGDTIIQPGDLLMLIADESNIPALREYVGAGRRDSAPPAESMPPSDKPDDDSTDG